MNLTACLLAQIFDAEITNWDHPDILDINPNLNVAKDYPIFVGRRVLGSSSTYSMTHYLHTGCGIDFAILRIAPDEHVTCLVEVNDGFSLGRYEGLSGKAYTDLLIARWEKLVGSI